MPLTRIFLNTQNDFRDLNSTSILVIAAEMAGFVLLDLFSDYGLPTLFIFLLFYHGFPIYLASYEPRTAARIRRYLKYVLKIYFVATIVYIHVCVLFAYLVFTDASSGFNKHVEEIRECAYRFEENGCMGKTNGFIGRVRGVERECFALAMCLRQPLFLLQIYGFLQELLAQIFSQGSFNCFVVMTGCYVAWGLGSGWWIRGMGSNVNTLNTTNTHASTNGNIYVVGNTPPDPVPHSNPLAEAGGHEHALDIQANLRIPHANEGAQHTPPLFHNNVAGALPRRRSPPFRAHPNPLRQHPDILTSGVAPRRQPPPAGERVAPPQEQDGFRPDSPRIRPQAENPFLDPDERPFPHHVAVRTNSPGSGATGILLEGLVDSPIEEVMIQIPLREGDLGGGGETVDDNEIVEIPIPDGAGNGNGGNREDDEQSLFDT
ncbi:hypothetical protein BGZ57DRAFT_988340 [Hyaloscypha finlandica]|nr:hypothetical protein BGZ57DRAFT_988340 [Hyaloscypha finlandica]